MSERSSYDHGVPSWVDLTTSDIGAAKSFYGALFGWEATDVANDGAAPYTMFSKQDKAVAGGNPYPPDYDGPPFWATYINVDSVDEAVAKTESAGGTVMVPATDAMEEGRFAWISDPSGGALGLWEPRNHRGAQLVNEHGAFSWCELITDDTAAAQKFLGDVLGWGAESSAMPTGTYTSFMVGDRSVAGMMAKPAEMAEMPNAWTVYFGHEDPDAAASATSEAGGAIIRQPWNVPNVGRMAVLSDPQGAAFMVWHGPEQ